jgi:hypothetical protein
VHGTIQAGTHSVAWHGYLVLTSPIIGFLTVHRVLSFPSGASRDPLLRRPSANASPETGRSDQIAWLCHTELNPDRVVRVKIQRSNVKQKTQDFFRYRSIKATCAEALALSPRAELSRMATWL